VKQGAGCGISLQAIMLAEAMGPGGRVTGVDLSPEFLDCTRSIAEKAGMSEQVSFQEGDMNNLPFDNDAFDWVWSANCAGYAPGEPLPLLKEPVHMSPILPGSRFIQHEISGSIDNIEATVSLCFWPRLSECWCINEVLLNIKLRAQIKGMIAEAGRSRAELVGHANNMFWLIMN